MDNMLVSYKEVLLLATFMLDVLARTPQPEEILTHGYEAEVSWKIKLDNLIHTSAVSDYDLGGDGDLFNAPKPIVEESLLAVNPLSAALSMISGYGSSITDETIQISDMKSIENEDLLCEVLNDWKGDLVSKSVTNVPTLEASNIPVSAPLTEGSSVEGSLQKSISTECLSTVDGANPSSVEPCLLGLHEMNFESAFGIRRAYSEGDIEILRTNNPVHGIMNTFPSLEFLASVEDAKTEEKIEARRIKLSRYRKKRTSRNYGRKIKYACRKALADCQPRVRGRFVKIEDKSATSSKL
ncbi:zinc finger protein CONSTANS-LIKE 9-like isoform X2 [Zingiber officinale]|uniref:zinc finger protein CONSTANS-LIKE 9-like isoform X2 n=1 Tax=Zingiber officinale TaxID=94328 RepID=UPI001C4BDDB2|nr:zinc finger protein CONSTANS-LIKE 9-like isoform X2 [Zingiber officinale]